MIVDLHVHSYRSSDSVMKPKDMLKCAWKRGLGCIGVTDHNTIKGALEVRALNSNPSLVVIVGEEIRTDIGDVIGLFLVDDVTSRRHVEVVQEIHDQGGLAVLPHPFRGHRLDEAALSEFDAIEAFNARDRTADQKRSMEFAQIHNKPAIAGSDAHFYSEIGVCNMTLRGDDIQREILSGNFTVSSAHSPFFMGFLSQVVELVRAQRLSRLPPVVGWAFLDLFRRHRSR